MYNAEIDVAGDKVIAANDPKSTANSKPATWETSQPIVIQAIMNVWKARNVDSPYELFGENESRIEISTITCSR